MASAGQTVLALAAVVLGVASCAAVGVTLLRRRPWAKGKVSGGRAN